MEAIILGNPYDIVQGSITPITVPAYEAEQAVVQLSDGFNPYTIGSSTTSTSDTYWFRYSTGLLRPLASSDSVVIGGTSLASTEKFRVVGKINSTSLQLGSTVTISSILDEDTMVSDSATAVPTQQSVKAYVDSKAGDYLSAGDNISLLTNDSGYIIVETDPIFTSSAAYAITTSNISNWNTTYGWGNHALTGYIITELDPVFIASASYSITSTQITNWDTAYSWGNHSLAGYITTETDPIFVASAAYSITSTLVTNWNTSYTNTHTHSNKAILDIIIGSGSGAQALFNDGTYKTVLTSVGGTNTQLIYNSSGTYTGSSSMIFDGTTTTINTLLTSLLEIGNSSTTIIKDSSGNLTFYDAVVASSYTLASLVGTATNFWTPDGSNIWYGYKVGIGGTGTFTEALEVTGNILADNFNSTYFKYDSNGNLLLGPNAGGQETSSSKLYIHNNNSTTPLIYGDFDTLDVSLGGNLTLQLEKGLYFGSTSVGIYEYDSGVGTQLYFLDSIITSAITLSDLRSGTFYSLVSAYSDHTAVLTITSANKTIWNKASYITITGDGTKYLSDNGVYNTITGSITVTDDILKWDTTTFRLYSSKSEAGGSSSIGKLFGGTTGPDATYRLNYDGYLYATSLYVSGTGSLTWQNSANADAYALYCEGVTGTNNILVLRNFASGDAATVLDIMSYTTDLTTQREATISFVRGDDINTELMDIYNNGYTSDTSYGIRLTKAGTGSWRNFNFDYYDTSTTTKTVIYQITPTPTFDFKIRPTVNGSELFIFSNGLSETSGSVILGGTLVQDTIITGNSGLFYLQFSELSSYQANVFDSITNGGSAIVLSNYSARLVGSGSDTTSIEFILDGLNGTFIVTNTGLSSFPGIQYSMDLSTNFTDRSLVDKGYVDSVISNYTFTSGLTNTSGIITWGGALTQEVDISGEYGLYILINSQVQIYNLDAATPDTIYGGVDINSSSVSMSCGDGTNFATVTLLPGLGFVYQSDYSASYNSRTLVDKGYVIGYAEPVLGNPSSDGYILSSTAAGVRSWISSSSGVTPVSDILYWDSSTSKYTSYTVPTAGCFDNSSTNPTGTTRLNYNGYFYATEVFGQTSTGIGIYGSSVSGYGTYGNSTSGMGIYGKSLAGIPGYFIQNGLPTSNVSSSVLYIARNHTTGTSYNITGNIITIEDNPTTSGTISGKILSVAVGTTERIYFNPRASASGTAYLFGTDTTLTSGGIHTQWSNGTTGSIAYLTYAGRLYTNNGVILGNSSGGYYTSIQTSQGLFNIVSNSVVRVNLSPEVVDSVSSVAYLFDTHNTLSTSGAKLASYKNSGTEKAYITNQGKYGFIVGTSSSFALVPGVLKDFYTDVSNSGTSETDLYSYTLSANTLSSNGDKLEVIYDILLISNLSTTLISIYFGSNSINISYGDTYNVNDTLQYHITMIRTSSSSIRYKLNIASGTMNQNSVTDLSGLDFTIDNVIKITGTGIVSTSVTAKMGIINYIPSAVN